MWIRVIRDDPFTVLFLVFSLPRGRTHDPSQALLDVLLFSFGKIDIWRCVNDKNIPSAVEMNLENTKMAKSDGVDEDLLAFHCQLEYLKSRVVIPD